MLYTYISNFIHFSFQPRQNLLNAASRVGEASTSVLHTIGEETEEDKETQVKETSPERRPKKSLLYRKLNYCYDNFYNVFFRKNGDKEYDTDFDIGIDRKCDDALIKDDGKNSDVGEDVVGKDFDMIHVANDKKIDDDGIYEDIDTSRNWGMLDVIQEESDSDYYRSVDYCNAIFNRNKELNDAKNKKCDDYETIIANCKDYLEPSPELQPKSVSDKIFNFKKDFSNHDYVNVDYDKSDGKFDRNEDTNNRDDHVYENLKFEDNNSPNINMDRRNKNDILRKRFFLSNNVEKNDINDQFNKLNDKQIECHSIRNDVIHNGPNTNVSGSLNMKIFNYDKYNRVLTTTETFMENAVASFTKNEIGKLSGDHFENFVKKSEKYYTTESRDRKTNVELNDSINVDKGKTEVRIFYNPTFKSTGDRYIRGFCQYCKRRCPKTDRKCCTKCECLELEMKVIWKENWLNILLILALVFVFIAVSIQCLFFKDSCARGNGTDAGDKCFEML